MRLLSSRRCLLVWRLLALVKVLTLTLDRLLPCSCSHCEREVALSAFLLAAAGSRRPDWRLLALRDDRQVLRVLVPVAPRVGRLRLPSAALRGLAAAVPGRGRLDAFGRPLGCLPLARGVAAARAQLRRGAFGQEVLEPHSVVCRRAHVLDRCDGRRLLAAHAYSRPALASQRGRVVRRVPLHRDRLLVAQAERGRRRELLRLLRGGQRLGERIHCRVPVLVRARPLQDLAQVLHRVLDQFVQGVGGSAGVTILPRDRE